MPSAQQAGKFATGPRDLLHYCCGTVAARSGWAVRRLLKPNDLGSGEESNAVVGPRLADHRPHRVMQRNPRVARSCEPGFRDPAFAGPQGCRSPKAPVAACPRGLFHSGATAEVTRSPYHPSCTASTTIFSGIGEWHRIFTLQRRVVSTIFELAPEMVDPGDPAAPPGGCVPVDLQPKRPKSDRLL